MKTCFFILFCLLLTDASPGGYYIPTNQEIDAWSCQWLEPSTVTASKDPSYAWGAFFEADLQDNGFGGFWKVAYGIQYGGWGPGSGLDLSAYDGYQLGIKNTHQTLAVMVNIFTNDGAGSWETWGFDENTWTWIAPGESVWLTLEKSQWSDPANIRKIGFQFGTNGPAAAGEELYKGAFLSVRVLPEPATVLLLGAGTALLRKVKKHT
jgi:hypothetical protein